MAIISTEIILDRIQELKDKKAAVEDMYNSQIDTYMAMLKEKMDQDGLDKFQTAGASATLSDIDQVEVTDWNDLFEYMEKHKAFSILQRRVAISEVTARLNAGEKIPGVKTSKVKRLTVRARKQGAKDED